MQTRCPFCQTRFNVTPEQLKMYAGKVRCGHCRNVFNAFETLVNQQTTPNPIEQAPSLNDIAPKLEIQFAHSASDESLQVKLDDDELESLQAKPFQEATLNDTDLIVEEVEDFSNHIAPPSYTPHFQAVPTEKATPRPTFLEPDVPHFPKAQSLEQKQYVSEPVSIAPEDLQLDIELAPSIVPESLVMDIPESIMPQIEVEPLFPEENKVVEHLNAPSQAPSGFEEALPEINPNFDIQTPSQLPQEEVPIDAPLEEKPDLSNLQLAAKEPLTTPIPAHSNLPKQMALPKKSQSDALIDKIAALESEFEKEEKEARRQAQKAKEMLAAQELEKEQTENKEAIKEEEQESAQNQESSLPAPSIPSIQEENKPSQPTIENKSPAPQHTSNVHVDIDQALFSTVNANYFSKLDLLVDKSDLLVDDPIYNPSTTIAEHKENLDSFASEEPSENQDTLAGLGDPSSAWYAPPDFLDQGDELTFAKQPKGLRAIGKDVFALGILSIVLLVQILFFFKNSIVENVPALRALYQSVGIALPLPRDLKHLTVESSDLNIDNENGIFKLQATLGNRAHFHQAWPNLELVLTDTFDQAILKRVLRPQDYLKNPQTPFFKAQSENHIQLWLKAQNIEAVGYRLSVFYPKESK